MPDIGQTKHPLIAALTANVPEMIADAAAQSFIGLTRRPRDRLRAGQCARHQGNSPGTALLRAGTYTIAASRVSISCAARVPAPRGF